MKKKLYYIIIVTLAALTISVLSSCKDEKTAPAIYAQDLVVEFDGKPHGIEARLSVQGGLIYEYTGIDNSYDSLLEPIQPGEYAVTITYLPSAMEKYKETCKTVKLSILLPYKIDGGGTELSDYFGASKNAVIPSKYRDKRISSLAGGTFKDKGIKTVKFPGAFFEAGPEMFAGCEGIETFYISANTYFRPGTYPEVKLEYYDNPETIGEQFGCASGFGIIEIPPTANTVEQASLAEIGAATLVVPSHLPLQALNLSEQIKTIRVYNGLRSYNEVPDNFFKNCKWLEKIVIEPGLCYLGDRIFENCSSLSELILPPSVQSRKEDTFVNCSLKKLTCDLGFSLGGANLPPALKEIVVTGNSISVPSSSFFGCEYVERIVLPASVEEIGGDAFWGCKKLTDLILPPRLKVIRAYAFSKCFSMTGFALPATVTEIQDGAFSECTSLTDIVLPSGIESISNHCFFGCENLRSVKIPDGVKTIGYSAFYKCEKLQSIKIPGGVKTIGYSAFYWCFALSEVILPDSLESIGFQAFDSCISLKEIKFPAGVKSFGYNVFAGCSNLEKVFILSETMPDFEEDAVYGTNTFYRLPAECKVCVPQNLLSGYVSRFPEINFVALD